MTGWMAWWLGLTLVCNASAVLVYPNDNSLIVRLARVGYLSMAMIAAAAFVVESVK